MTRDCGYARRQTAPATWDGGKCAACFGWCGDAGCGGCGVSDAGRGYRLRARLALLDYLVDFVALDVGCVPLPRNFPGDLCGTIARCTVIRPHRIIQVVPLVPGGLYLAGDVVICDVEVGTYVCEQGWE